SPKWTGYESMAHKWGVGKSNRRQPGSFITLTRVSHTVAHKPDAQASETEVLEIEIGNLVTGCTQTQPASEGNPCSVLACASGSCGRCTIRANVNADK